MPLSAPEGGALQGIGLVLGGARSGKSAFAESLVNAGGLAKLYLATGQAFDGEMAQRIAHHQARRGDDWTLVEEPLELAGILRERARPDTAVLVDCLTLWVSNLMMAQRDVEKECAALADALGDLDPRCGVVFVSNEVGLGIVPMDGMARAFRDHAGRLHQHIAKRADRVWFVTAGLPQQLK